MNCICIVTFLLLVGLTANDIVKCDGCNLMVNSIDYWMVQNISEPIIEKNMYTLCKLFPTYKQTCVTLANLGIHKVMNHISKYDNTHYVCVLVGLCDGGGL